MDAVELIEPRADLEPSHRSYVDEVGVRPSMRRQGYATEILRRSLLEARALGLRKIRVTCDKDNVASSRTILRNGGELDGEEFMPEAQRVVSRYWVSLA